MAGGGGNKTNGKRARVDPSNKNEERKKKGGHGGGPMIHDYTDDRIERARDIIQQQRTSFLTCF